MTTRLRAEYRKPYATRFPTNLADCRLRVAYNLLTKAAL
jgi:hypothetical protein